MRLLISFVALLMTLSGCRNTPRVRETAGPKTWVDSIASIDTTCLQEIDSAKADLQKGKLVFCKLVSLHIEPLSDKYLMDSLLGKFGISYQLGLVPDAIVEDQTPVCYCRYMRDQIITKFGRAFVDSVQHAMDSLAAMNAGDGRQ
ncbi:hypothetical protein [Paraflavitalea sp. CAU 1676]|uniref:hypothetical protein n=1 Tax=Paraflavitalea sp. CAU 1676 TaxID=3032598 RepID=UPI0023DB523B|nr:hypothetical protein [Paraflavitalea sp. CAU 1676]MDF2193362.1 hypothetical protein [Paraflavitalea sp. CAU 1676]